MIIDTEYPLSVDYVRKFDSEMYPMNKNRPTVIFPVGDEDNGEFLTLENPDKTYGVRIRYYQDLSEMKSLFFTIFRC